MKYTLLASVLILLSCVPGTPSSPALGAVATRGGVGGASPSGAAEKGTVMDNVKIAVLGGGCFWCLEGAFEIVPGVLDVESGYAGGARENPSYEQVSSGLTGHAEVVRISYDPALVSYAQLLELFFKIHDPTTEDRQGADVGSQYRSIILYADEDQRLAAEKAIRDEAGYYRSPIVTEVLPLRAYWKAEDYHQDYYRNNPQYGYCKVVVKPKIDKASAFVETLAVPNK